jgi:hypothetical protein
MRQPRARLTAVAIILSTVSCSGDGPDFIWFRAMHAMPDTPVVRVEFENYVFRRTLDFGATTTEGGESLLGGSGSTTRMTAEYFGPRNQVAGTLLELDVPVAVDSISTVILAGSFDAPEPMVVVSPRRTRPLGALYFQFAHATPALGALDIYVTAPDTDLAATAPIATVQPLDYANSIEVPFGGLRIRLAAAGTLDIVMDSGELNFAEQTGPTGPGAEWLIAVTPSLTSGPSPVQLIGSSGRSSLAINDAGTTATLRAYHALVGIPAVELVAATEPETTVVTGLEFTARSPVVAVPGEVLGVDFRLTGEPDQVVATRELPFENGAEYALFLAGPTETPEILAVETRSRSIASQARLRFAHVASGSEFFSIYLTGSEDEARSADNRILLDLRYGQILDYLAINPGEYFVTFTRRFYNDPANAADAEETTVLGPEPLPLAGGDVFTYAIFAPEVEGDPETITLFDDLQP